MITREEIKVFDSYAGDIDGLARVGRDYERKLFDNNDWSRIDSFYQDIELINKGLTAESYLVGVIAKLKVNCDHESFNLLANKIECYKDFQKVAAITKQLKAFISKSTDTIWAGFDNADKFLDELNQDIEKIENCDYQTLEKVRIEFLPTCTYQELSMSNGWSDKYLELSTDFDKLYERITDRKTAHDSTLPKTGRSWWQKLFGSE